jgi:PAS domain S-box-containing protein
MPPPSDQPGRDELQDRIIGLGERSQRRSWYPELQEKLREIERREALFRGLFDGSPQFMGILDPDGTVLEANRSALDFIAAEAAAMRGRPFWDTPWWSEPGQAARLRGWVARAAAGEPVRAQVPHRGRDGRRIDVDFSLTPCRDEAGVVRFLIAEGHDISARLDLERQAIATRDLAGRLAAATDLDPALGACAEVATLLAGTGVGSAHRIEADGHVTLTAERGMPPALCEALALLPPVGAGEAFRGGALWLDDLAAAGSGPAGALATLVGGAAPALRSLGVVPVGDGQRPLAALLVASTRPDAFPPGVRDALAAVAALAGGALARIAAEQGRRQLEVQLRQVQKMEAVGQLAGGIAHDFNNMLGAIMGSADLLAQRTADDPAARELVSMVVEATERAADLTRQLLAFARNRTADPRPTDLHRAITDAVALLRRSIDPSIRVHLDLAATGAVVLADPARLQSAVLNLGLNARDAMPAGGEFAIATGELELDAGQCAASPFPLRPGRHLVVTVSDTGVGMGKAVLDRVFEPFFTTKPQGRGTGLGLAMVYGTVKDLHGAITVASSPGAGTSFRILLPASATAADTAPPVEAAAHGHGCVLVVEDEPVVRTMAECMLASLGYRVLLAADGREGVDLYTANRWSVDAVLLDLVMPRMNGRETFLALRRLDPLLPMVLTSGFSRDLVVDELRALGRCGFVAKPYRTVELGRAIATAMAERRRPPPA